MLARVRRLFDLDSRPDVIDAHLGELASGSPGLRVPGAFDGVEIAIRAMAGERLAATHESTPVLARLAERFGTSIEGAPPGLTHALPSAATLAALPPSALDTIGIAREPARAIVSLARAVHDGTLSLEPMAPLDMTLDALRALPGFDEHAVQYVAMRAMVPAECVPGRRCVAARAHRARPCAIIRAACGALGAVARVCRTARVAPSWRCVAMTPAHLIPALGDIAVRIEDDALTGLYFVGQKYFPPVAIVTDADATAMSPLARKVAEEVAEYFTGMRETFSVPIHLRGTAFQRRVWKELLAIPFGELVTYGDITERVGLPMSGARAVGGAVGRNPVSIMVPCHRVVGASGASPAMRAASIASARCCRSKARGSSAAPTIRCNRRSRSERKCATASCVQHRRRASRFAYAPGVTWNFAWNSAMNDDVES